MAVVERWPLLGRRGEMKPLFLGGGGGGLGGSTTCLLCRVILLVTYNGNEIIHTVSKICNNLNIVVNQVKTSKFNNIRFKYC